MKVLTLFLLGDISLLCILAMYIVILEHVQCILRCAI